MSDWWLFVIPVGVGLLSAGQTIEAKTGIDFFQAATTASGFVYWLSRGLVPLGAFAIWHFTHQNSEQPWIAALTCGIGAEAILRSKLYIGPSPQANDGKREDLFMGAFNLIEWYQAYFLRRAGISLAARKQKLVQPVVDVHNDFPKFGQKVSQRAGGLSPTDQQGVRDRVNEMRQAFNAAKTQKDPEDLPALHKEYIMELAFFLLNLLGKGGLNSFAGTT